MKAILGQRLSLRGRSACLIFLLVLIGIHIAVPESKGQVQPKRYGKTGPYYYGKPTEVVVIKYEQLIREGALLTPKGWNRAGSLFSSSAPYSKDADIILTSTAAQVGEVSVNGDRAEVETKWGDSYGSIDAQLRYKPIEAPRSAPLNSIALNSIAVIGRYHLVLVKAGTSDSAVGNKTEWRIEGSQRRYATLDAAIRYVAMMRDRSSNPVVKKNAEKTLAILRRLRHGCGRASAC